MRQEERLLVVLQDSGPSNGKTKDELADMLETTSNRIQDLVTGLRNNPYPKVKHKKRGRKNEYYLEEPPAIKQAAIEHDVLVATTALLNEMQVLLAKSTDAIMQLSSLVAQNHKIGELK